MKHNINLNLFIENELKTFHPTFEQICDIAEVVKKYAKEKCAEQRHICQVDLDKNTIVDVDGDIYIYSKDILFAKEPEFN